MGHGLQLYPLFLCRLYDDLFQLAACCTCRCHKEPICCLRDGKDPCRWRKGRDMCQSFFPQLDQLSYHHNSKWAILGKNKRRWFFSVPFGFLWLLSIPYGFKSFRIKVLYDLNSLGLLIQLGTMNMGLFVSYVVFWGYFDQLKLHLKVKQIWIGSFKWGTKHSFWSRGWKNIRGQSWEFK